MSDTFFSNDNVEYLYSLVRGKIHDQTNKNLDHYPKYKTNMAPLMEKVYSSADGNHKQDILYLNKKAVSGIVPFFRQLVNKKTTKLTTGGYGIHHPIVSNYSPNNAVNPNPQRSMMENPISSNSTYDSNLEMTIMKRKDNVSNYMDNAQKERDILDRNMNPNSSNGQLPDFSIDATDDNTHISRDYESLMHKRNNELSVRQNTNPPTPAEVEEFQNQIKLQNFTQSVPRNNDNTGYKLDSFDLDNNLARDLGQPLYNNLDSLSDSPEDIKKLHEKLQKGRQDDIGQYQTYQQQQQEMLQVDDETKQDYLKKQLQTQMTNMDQVGSYLERRNRAGVNIQNDGLNINPDQLYGPVQIEQTKTKGREAENNILQHVDNQQYFYNQLPGDNEKFNNYLDGLREGKGQYGKRNYMETDHYVTVNSDDRLWENDAENRYNFVVHFNSSDFSNGASVPRSFKNIVSIELLKLIIPQDHHPMPFDHRLYIDFLSFPYLSLHIDEIDGVFYGTSNSTAKAFEHVVFDKEYTSETLTSEQITNEHSTSGVKHKFAKQYKRGHYALCPMYDEKKIYYHTPKASLNRMTIRLLTSDGKVLSPLNDHLKLSAIVFETVADKELTGTLGFPRTAGQNTIKITTVNYFSNRTFRIGDKLLIKNYTVTSSADNDVRFQEFINRAEGHYIINLDEEVTGASANEGWFNNIYISPPGEIDYSTGTLDATTYYTATPTVSDYGDILNTSLQMHLMFRITVREDESRNILQPHNI
jgi:hypothetical protein